MTDQRPVPSDPPPPGQVLIYQDGATRLQVRLDGQTVWLTQRLIAELFQITTPTVNEHLANIYDESELDPTATIRKFRIVQIEGNRQVRRAMANRWGRESFSLTVIRSRTASAKTTPDPCGPFAESAKLEQAIRSNLKELGYGS